MTIEPTPPTITCVVIHPDGGGHSDPGFFPCNGNTWEGPVVWSEVLTTIPPPTVVAETSAPEPPAWAGEQLPETGVSPVVFGLAVILVSIGLFLLGAVRLSRGVDNPPYKRRRANRTDWHGYMEDEDRP